MKEGIVCFIFCFGTVTEPSPSIIADSFCEVYERQIITKTDAQSVKLLPPDVQKRVQGNEVLYLCRCKGWKDKVCQKLP